MTNIDKEKLSYAEETVILNKMRGLNEICPV